MVVCILSKSFRQRSFIFEDLGAPCNAFSTCRKLESGGCFALSTSLSSFSTSLHMYLQFDYGPASFIFNNLFQFYPSYLLTHQIWNWCKFWLRIIRNLLPLLGLSPCQQHNLSLLNGISDLMSYSALVCLL